MTRPGLRPGSRQDLAQVPHGHTANRLDWVYLPPYLRAEIGRRLGSPVASAESRDAGFTPGFASVLTGENRSRVFVKAASKQAQGPIAASYADEVRKLRALPATLPMPRLRWVHDDDSWIVLGFDVADGRPPRRPWDATELERALDLAEEIATRTDPLPPGLGLVPLAEDFPGLVGCWDRVAHGPHRDEAADLAAAYVAMPHAAFCHGDLRDDNVLLGRERAWAVDWNWCVLGQPWQDTVDLLVSAYGDGLDVEAVLARRRLTRDVDPAHLDAWLAALGGFMEEASLRRAPNSSPWLKVHSRWYAEALWGWLSERRGWS